MEQEVGGSSPPSCTNRIKNLPKNLPGSLAGHFTRRELRDRQGDHGRSVSALVQRAAQQARIDPERDALWIRQAHPIKAAAAIEQRFHEIIDALDRAGTAR